MVISSLPGTSGGGTEVMSSLGREAITTMKYRGNAERTVTNSRITTRGLGTQREADAPYAEWSRGHRVGGATGGAAGRCASSCHTAVRIRRSISALMPATRAITRTITQAIVEA